MAFLDFARELRPHFIFWLLEKAVGAVVIASILATVQYLQHHLDATSIGVVFVAAVATLVWIDRRKGTAVQSANIQPAEEPIGDPLSNTEYQIWLKASGDFRALSWQQKVALRDIYQAPGRRFVEYRQGLENRGFADPGPNLLAPIVKTSLVVIVKPNGQIDPASNSKIANMIEELIAKTPL
jgi:hypothetical protein